MAVLRFNDLSLVLFDFGGSRPHHLHVDDVVATINTDWNTHAIVAIIELARGKGNNPEMPKWLEEDYLRAIRELAEIGAAEIWRTDEPDTVRAILGVIAIAKGLRTHGKFLVEYSEDEMLDFESRL